MRLSVAVLLGWAMVLWVSQAFAAQPAKNVILLIADGAGFNAWQAASYYEHGQLGQQPYDRFAVHYGCTTYMLNYVNADGAMMAASVGKIPNGASGTIAQEYDPSQMWRNFNYARGKDNYTAATDSAAAATALYTGVKTTRGRMAMSWEGKKRLTTIAEIADRLGKATGTISSVQVSHATPGAVWAHNPSRNNYAALFREMLYESGLDVIMGAGHPLYDNNGKRRNGGSDDDYQYVGGKQAWKDLTSADPDAGLQLIQQKDEFEALAERSATGGDGPSRRVVGIAPVHSTLQADRKGKDMAPGSPQNANVPALATITRAALNVLAEDPDGFFLMVEGGAVDWANHSNNLARMVEEMGDFNRSVQAVVDWVEANSSWDETLVIVTADHECGMLWGQGTYANGDDDPHYNAGTDTFLNWQPVKSQGKGRLPQCQYGSGGHTNALVPLWANGPGSERFAELVDGTDAKAGEFWGFSGKYVDNTDVFTVMKAAFGSRTDSPPQPAPEALQPAAAVETPQPDAATNAPRERALQSRNRVGPGTVPRRVPIRAGEDPRQRLREALRERVREEARQAAARRAAEADARAKRLETPAGKPASDAKQ
ncbi:MAG: alkaline phosphatase [Pirellulales bacterium]|nr:alkaline phosphatase [Pirellulales bacterium]